MRNDGPQQFSKVEMHFEPQFISDASKGTSPVSPFCMILAKELWEGARGS